MHDEALRPLLGARFAGHQPTAVTDPIVIDTAEILHWTEQAREFHVNESFSDAVFMPPPSTR